MKKLLLSAAIISAFLFSLPYSASADEISFFELLFQESDTGGLEPGIPPPSGDAFKETPDSGPKTPMDSLGRAFRWKFDGIGQLRLTSVENDKFLRESGDDSYLDALSVEHVWFSVLFEENPLKVPNPRWQGTLVWDFAAENSNLVDFWVRYKYKDPDILMDGGQMRVPFGWQMHKNPDQLLTPNYAQVLTALFGDFRRRGIRVSGDTIWKELFYSAAIFKDDTDKRGAACLRIGWRPIVEKTRDKIEKELNFGLSYYLSRYETGSADPADERLADRARFGFDFRARFKDIIAQGEFVTNAGSTDMSRGGDEPDTWGGFVEAALVLQNSTFMPTVRLDVLDRDGDPLGRRTDVYYGFTFQSRENVAIQLFYVNRREEHLQPNTGGGSVLHNDEFIAQLTIKF
jgi:hypothetical protein